MWPRLSPERREWRINKMERLAAQDLQIRRVKSDDISAISEIEQVSFKDPFPSYFFSQLADANPETFLVAILGGKIIGYAVVDRWPDQEHLVSIAISPGSTTGPRRGILDSPYNGYNHSLTWPNTILLFRNRQQFHMSS